MSEAEYDAELQAALARRERERQEAMRDIPALREELKLREAQHLRLEMQDHVRSSEEREFASFVAARRVALRRLIAEAGSQRPPL